MIDKTYRGHDERQPPQEQFRARSSEYMAAFRRYAELPDNDNLCRLLSFSKTQRVHCPRCNARMTDGNCWQGCYNEAALASQREVNAAICAAYNKVQAGFPLDETFDDEPACGNVRAEEAVYYAHPD